MGLLDRLRGRKFVPDDEFSPMPGFRIDFGEVTRFVTDTETLALMRAGTAQQTAQEQFLVLDMLAEEGRATATDDGYDVSAEELARLTDDEAAVLRLPSKFTGEIHTSVSGVTSADNFSITLALATGRYPETPHRRGPVVRLGRELFRLSTPLYRSLRALEAHDAIPQAERTELDRLRLVARLQAAQVDARFADDPADRDATFRISLGALDSFTTVTPKKVGLTVEPQPDGSLAVEPNLGDGVDPDVLRRRWHQLDRPGDRTGRGDVIRAENTLVILEPEQQAAVQEVRSRPQIPKEAVPQFLDAPGAFYDPELIDVDIELGVRVAGIGIIAPVSFNEAAANGLDWFASLDATAPPETLARAARTQVEQRELEDRVTHAWERGEHVVPVDRQLVDVSDRNRVEEAFAASRERLEALGVFDDDTSAAPSPPPPGDTVTVGMHIVDTTDLSAVLRERALQARPASPVDYASLRRAPLPHQREGIEWMVGLMASTLGSSEGDRARIQGALLADDMGLGKTYMTLVALAEYVRAQRELGQDPLPTLAVMPVALLANWLDEIEATFGSRHGPFDEVVVLQGQGLGDYRKRGTGAETAASVEDLDEHGMVRQDRLTTSLRVGAAHGEARLDRPNVLVLTTYETLRRYQVSLGTVNWGVVVFDEAQYTKNPETLASRAAKGLKARFKLLATGTPVENSLRDFWSLVDTAQPNLLGTWQDFRRTWADPIAEATGEEHDRLGRALRESVGQFMLRRVKEDHLADLPPKETHEYPHAMPARQVHAYDEVLESHRAHAGAKGAALKTLHALQKVSLHPGLLDGSIDPDVRQVDESARTLVTVRTILDDVRERGEKAIIFAVTKEMQRYLALWLSQRYGLRVDIVNGDTAAVGTESTRLSRIRAFESRDGFNVIIMSPLAVGVGLTVVGANHAIHLERHWNPAKEAQATDRIYRIGQTRPVHVHYPLAMHPELASFDVHLDRLLKSKVALKDAVVVPQEVGQEELEKSLGLV